MHSQNTSIDEGFVDELSSRIEVDAHVEGGGIMSLDAVISDVHPSVILGTASPLALGTVEDVCNLEFGQLSSVWCDISAEKTFFAAFCSLLSQSVSFK